jgi:phospholipase/lecithinase/hemolysin
MEIFMKKVFLLMFLAVLWSIPALAADSQELPSLKTPFTAIVAFGDSFTDDGFADGHGFKRYTETLTWVEYLAKALELPLDNWAWGGALSDARNCNHPEGVTWSGLLWQVDEYLNALPQGADLSNIHFTIMVGSNDVWMGISDPQFTATNIGQAVRTLAKAGAKNILYRETTAVMLSPGYLAGDYAKYAEPWTKLVDGSNLLTRVDLKEKVITEFPDLKIYYHETDPLFQKVKKGQKGFKFEIIDKPWWGTYSMPTPYAYLWYDEWHPTGQLHKLIAADSLDSLKAALK